MVIVKENKEKELDNGNEVVQAKGAVIAQTRPPPSKALRLVPPASLEKRRTVSKTMDIGNLPSCRDLKRPKVDSSTPSKTQIIKIDPAIPHTILVSSFVTPNVDVLTPPIIGSLSFPPSIAPPKDNPLTLLRSETLAWDRFKQVMKDEDVNICYDMSMKEFE